MSAQLAKVQASFLSKLEKRRAAKHEGLADASSGCEGSRLPLRTPDMFTVDATPALHADDLLREAEAAEVLAQEHELSYAQSLTESGVAAHRAVDVSATSVLRELEALDAAAADAEAAALRLCGGGVRDAAESDLVAPQATWQHTWLALESLVEEEVALLLGARGAAVDAAAGRAARLLRRLCEVASSTAAAFLAARTTCTGEAMAAAGVVLHMPTVAGAPVALLERIVMQLEPGTAWALVAAEQAWLLQQLRMVPRVARVQAAAYARANGAFSAEDMQHAHACSRLCCARARLTVIASFQR